jgi:hypothetical protein
MASNTSRPIVQIGALAVLVGAGAAPSALLAQDAAAQERLEALQRQVKEQSDRLEALKRAMAQEQTALEQVKQALGREVLAGQRARGQAPSDGTLAQAQPGADASRRAAVGQAPEAASQSPALPQIFDQPGVLTPRGKMVLEPSLQYSYSSSNRIALVGYTVIPAILIGVIDVREVKRNTVTTTLTGRYGLTNRFEIEARLPHVYRSDSSIGREVLQGSSVNTVFDASGNGIGDVELTARYQLNDTTADRPTFVGSLRFKSRTGRDPFEVETSRGIVGLRDGVQTRLPTGSGFYGLQPAITALFPSDPVVFFGTVSYLHNLKRSNVVRNTDTGPEDLGTVQPGGVFGFNFGMGLGLNEKTSFSIGYDHASVGRTKQNGAPAADSVRVQLGTLLLGYNYQLSPQRSLSVSLGAGLTRDTPDISLTVRLPMTY